MIQFTHSLDVFRLSMDIHCTLFQDQNKSTGPVDVLGLSMDIHCINTYPRVQSSPLVLWMSLDYPWTSTASTSIPRSDPVHWSCGCPWTIHGHLLHQNLSQGPIQSTGPVDVLGPQFFKSHLEVDILKLDN